jgi:hypothetical protein
MLACCYLSYSFMMYNRLLLTTPSCCLPVRFTFATVGELWYSCYQTFPQRSHQPQPAMPLQVNGVIQRPVLRPACALCHCCHLLPL